MATSSELKEIRDLIFQYKNTANKEEKSKLKKILKHELNLLKHNM